MLPNPRQYQDVKWATNYEVQMKIALTAHASKHTNCTEEYKNKNCKLEGK